MHQACEQHLREPQKRARATEDAIISHTHVEFPPEGTITTKSLYRFVVTPSAHLRSRFFLSHFERHAKAPNHWRKVRPGFDWVCELRAARIARVPDLIPKPRGQQAFTKSPRTSLIDMNPNLIQVVRSIPELSREQIIRDAVSPGIRLWSLTCRYPGQNTVTLREPLGHRPSQ